MAVALHRNHSRKGTRIPYSSHLLAVASLVLEHGGTEDEAIAALLHDTLEDQSTGRLGELKDAIGRFGGRVLAIVQACSDTETASGKPPWRDRKRAYIAHLAHVSDSARLVSLADKVHNARAILADYLDLGETLWDRFNGGREGTLWYYRALVEAFRPKGNARLVAELERLVSELERRAAAAQGNS